MQQLLRRCIPVIARYRDRAPRFSPEALAGVRQQPRRAPWGSEGSGGGPSGRKSDGQETIYPSRVDSDNDIPAIADEEPAARNGNYGCLAAALQPAARRDYSVKSKIEVSSKPTRRQWRTSSGRETA